MHKLTISALALFLAGAWTVVPVGAQDTMKDKAERAGDKIENKAERAGDKIENKADKAEDKGDSAMDKLKAKTRETKDKLKAKTSETKDKLEAKTDRAKDKLDAKTDRAEDKLAAKGDRTDVRTMQQALKDRGHDPGPIDGVHGPRTTAALRNFQQAEGLNASGRLDQETMAKLNMPSASAGSTDTTQPSASPGAPPVQQRQSR